MLNILYILFISLVSPIIKLGGEGHNKIKLIENKKVYLYTQLWLYDMGSSNIEYPEFMYMDIINERDNSVSASKNKLHYYIGYYSNLDNSNELEYQDKNIEIDNQPIYIGGLILNPKERSFNLNTIIQNPTVKEEFIFNNYILELEDLCYDCNISLAIENLKNYSSARYWLSINSYF